MQIDLDYLKMHYAALSDEALLEIHEEELVEGARPIYDAELAERGLTPRELVEEEEESSEAAEEESAEVQ